MGADRQEDREALFARPVVAHINHHFFTLTETFIYTYLTGFRRFRPICISWWTNTNLSLFPFPTEDLLALGPSGEGKRGPILSKLRRTSIEWRHPEFRKMWAEGLNRGYRFLNERDARVVHAHFGPMGWKSIPLKKVLGIPLVTSFYGYDLADRIESEGPEWVERRTALFHEGDLFLVEGPFMRDRLLEIGCPPDKVRLQRIAIDLSRYRFPPPPHPGRGPAVVLFVGRLAEKKGPLLALEAVRLLNRKGRDVEFRIVGDGELASQVKDAAADMDDRVVMLGELSHDECIRQMENSDVLLQPSVVAADGDTEGGAPTVILEAQALGVPVVSTTHADIPNVTLPNRSALLVPERDPEALADALDELVTDPQKRREMGNTGRRFVEDFHDIRAEVETLEDNYLRLI